MYLSTKKCKNMGVRSPFFRSCPSGARGAQQIALHGIIRLKACVFSHTLIPTFLKPIFLHTNFRSQKGQQNQVAKFLK